jgi:hypothetical protein
MRRTVGTHGGASDGNAVLIVVTECSRHTDRLPCDQRRKVARIERKDFAARGKQHVPCHPQRGGCCAKGNAHHNQRPRELFHRSVLNESGQPPPSPTPVPSRVPCQSESLMRVLTCLSPDALDRLPHERDRRGRARRIYEVDMLRRRRTPLP